MASSADASDRASSTSRSAARDGSASGPVVRLGHAADGDLVQTGVSRLARGSRRNYSRVDHLCIVLHRYGPHGDLIFVRPICGAEQGRADTANEYGTLCKRCEAKHG